MQAQQRQAENASPIRQEEWQAVSPGEQGVQGQQPRRATLKSRAEVANQKPDAEEAAAPTLGPWWRRRKLKKKMAKEKAAGSGQSPWN